MSDILKIKSGNSWVGIPAIKGDYAAVDSALSDSSTNPVQNKVITVPLVRAEAEAIGAYPVDTASGSVANFPDGAGNVPVKDLKIAIEPVQTGSGDPAPDNVRTITGWTGVTISQSGADTSDPDTVSISWQTEAGTVYGGTLDVTTGVLTANRAKKTIAELGFTYQSANTRFYTSALQSVAKRPSTSSTNLLCEVFPCVPDAMTGKPNNSVHIASSGNLFITKTTYTSKTALESAVGSNYISYELGTPLTYQLTPAEVKTLLGTNNIWADTGDTTVQYRADPTLYVDRHKRTIAPVEDGDKASQAYAAGKYFYHNGNFCKAKTSIASGATFTLNTNYEVTTVAAELYTALH